MRISKLAIAQSFGCIFTLLLTMPAEARSTPVASAIYEIEIERSECKNACPAYTININKNGQITFFGKKHVQTTGEATGTISAKDWKYLGVFAQRIHFTNLNNNYETTKDGCSKIVADAATLMISIQYANHRKQVQYYTGCTGPKELKTIALFGETIDVVAGTQRWIGKP